jgi:hypothetical protein
MPAPNHNGGGANDDGDASHDDGDGRAIAH